MIFFHKGQASGTKDSLVDAWRQNCPQVAVLPYDLDAAFRASVVGQASAVTRAVFKRGPRVLRRGSGLIRDANRRSAWMNRRLSRFAMRHHAVTAADFSLSYGSTLDCAWGDRPHFIYTDLTILANLYYPNGEQAVTEWFPVLPSEIRSLRKATAVFTKSRHVSESLVSQYGVPKERVICVRYGPNVDFADSCDVQPSGTREILFVGVEWERKGGPELLDAFKRVRDQLPDATLKIVGCRPAVSSPGVVVVGPVDRKDMASFYRRAAVFCLPSWREASGNAYLEAMSAGLPVVASEYGATPDFITDGVTGYTVRPDDIERLSDIILRLLNDAELRTTIGQGGRTVVRERYNWTAVQALMWEAIQQMLPPHPRAHR